jgi:cell division protein ZapA
VAKELKKYKMTIAGESYFLVSDEPEERIHQVAQYVDDNMRRIAQLGHADDPQRLAVLVALQSASKMMEYLELTKTFQQRHEQMIDQINQEVVSESPLSLT